MINTYTPKPLWDHCLELEGGIRTLTALEIYGLRDQVPETIMAGKTGDISPYCEFEWFQWIVYYKPTAAYPDDKCFVGHWLGPATDEGSSMTYKIEKSNGSYVCRSTVRAWTPQEEDNPDLLRARKEFMVRLKDELGRAAEPHNFSLEDLTPEFPNYADGIEDGFTGCPDEIDLV